MGAAQVAVGDPRMPDNLLAKRPRVRGAGHVVLNGAQSLGKRPQRRLELFHTRREAVDLGCLLLDLRLQRPVAFKMGGSLSCRTADGSAPENAQDGTAKSRRMSLPARCHSGAPERLRGTLRSLPAASQPNAVYRILRAEGLNRLTAQSRSRKPDGLFKEYGLGFVHLDVKHLPS
jgi:hypothetical protein